MELNVLSGETSSSTNEDLVYSGRKVHLPVVIPISTVLFCVEVVSAGILCGLYSWEEETLLLALTILFLLVPSVLIQLTLTFLYQDSYCDQFFIQFLHVLQLGPVIRFMEAMITYYHAGRVQEPYFNIICKKHLMVFCEKEIEEEVSRSFLLLDTHCNAFKRVAVIQAFLGSVPQLTLQLYASLEEGYIPIERGFLMITCFASITNGALICSILAIEMRYDDYRIQMKPVALVCISIWRVLEIATRVIVLVIFCSALTFWICLIVLTNIIVFSFFPWIQFWRSKAPLPEFEDLTKFGTSVVLCLLTFTYVGINTFCWSAIHLNFSDQDLIEKSLSWHELASYYVIRLLENVLLILLWHFHKTDFYEDINTPLLAVQLLTCYCIAILFMLFFYYYCHPCQRLFTHSFANWLQYICCQRTPNVRTNSNDFNQNGELELLVAIQNV
ncbi:membrane transport protein XK-like [Protopterus annectens]|uniref:membrane transport protein XK-like n=1 Tax=Protopterus annectens TaxID=7888 RepID=UPI001CFBB4ED|nr:membrane transport protein XK-like [Protopterus annectens]